MKKFTSLLLVLFGIILVIPFKVGGVVKTRFAGGIIDFNATAATTAQSQLIDYERGGQPGETEAYSDGGLYRSGGAGMGARGQRCRGFAAAFDSDHGS